jgi:hypothetical protein
MELHSNSSMADVRDQLKENLWFMIIDLVSYWQLIGDLGEQ